MVSPLRNLGSTQVDFGGINMPWSATFFTADIGMGYRKNATWNEASFTWFNTFTKGVFPGTKEISSEVFLSLIPIGVGIAHVIYATKSMDAASQKESRTKFVKHLVTLLAVFGIFFAVEFALIYVGTFTGFSHFFSAVFASGTLLGSFFLIFNGGLLVFCLSALPSYSLDFNGSNKELLGIYIDFTKNDFSVWLIKIFKFFSKFFL